MLVSALVQEWQQLTGNAKKRLFDIAQPLPAELVNAPRHLPLAACPSFLLPRCSLLLRAPVPAA